MSRPPLPSPHPRRRLPSAAGGFLVLVALSGCGEKNVFVPPPPPEVEVIPPNLEPVTVFLELPARTTSFARAEVRARVKGFLQEIHFQPGRPVKAGAPLFTIERDQFEAALASAEGQLERAQADLGIATTNLEKRTQAGQTGAVSKIDIAAAEAERKAAAAAVKMAEASVQDAKRDLSYTGIASPMDGMVSKSEIDIGNLVGADGPTLLTTVVQDHPIFAEFEINERDILRHLPKRRLVGNERPDREIQQADIRLTLSDGTIHPLTGRVDFLDNTVDPETGTIRARARFDNPDGSLISGLFVRVGIPWKFENAGDSGPIRVPAEVVQRDLAGSFVLVVGEGNRVERRPVEASSFREGPDAILTSGLTAGDRVIVSNLQKARPGLVVTPRPARAAPPPPSGGDATPEA